MLRNKEEIAKWARSVVESPYWEDLKNECREDFINLLIEAAQNEKMNEVRKYGFLIGQIDYIAQKLFWKSLDDPERALKSLIENDEGLIANDE